MKYKKTSDDLRALILYYFERSVQEHGGDVAEVTAENREALNAVHRYLMQTLFESAPQYGLMFHGPVGTGKSIIIDVFRRVFSHITNRTIKEYTSPYIRANFYENSTDRVSLRYILHTNRQIAINDLGFERSYQSGEDVIQMVLFDRCERGLITHGTTNLSPIEFTRRYNDDKNRMADRFPTMFKFIEISGKSFRKNLVIK